METSSSSSSSTSQQSSTMTPTTTTSSSSLWFNNNQRSKSFYLLLILGIYGISVVATNIHHYMNLSLQPQLTKLSSSSSTTTTTTTISTTTNISKLVKQSQIHYNYTVNQLKYHHHHPIFGDNFDYSVGSKQKPQEQQHSFSSSSSSSSNHHNPKVLDDDFDSDDHSSSSSKQQQEQQQQQQEQEQQEQQHYYYPNHHPVLDDFDLFNTKQQCGVDKCFVPSKANPNLEGYLIAKNSPRRFQTGYDYGQYLEDTYNISNIMLGPPYQIHNNKQWDISSKGIELPNGIPSKKIRLVRVINDEQQQQEEEEGEDTTTTNSSSSSSSSSSSTTTKNDDGDDGNDGSNTTTTTTKLCINSQHKVHNCTTPVNLIRLDIQRVRVIDVDNSFLMKCRPERNYKSIPEWDNASISFTSKINNITNFLNEFEISLEKFIVLMINEPTFVNDIQFYISTDGQFIQMDYDRVLNGRYKMERNESDYMDWVQSATNNCFHLITKMKNDIINIIENSNNTTTTTTS